MRRAAYTTGSLGALRPTCYADSRTQPGAPPTFRDSRCGHPETGYAPGEIELDDGDISGIAVAIGARVGSLAGPGEVLVSSTVKDLVAGSGLVFEDRGPHVLKGVPGEWRLYVANAGA